MSRQLCIHGHFYQPPRIDPWLEDVLPEGSAAPEHDWNARITKESYAPLAWARRLDGSGMIQELVNCYEWISFNFGPTLLGWMELHAPETYARILEADRNSLKRLGHGNALAQVYHHAIMPLATDMDKELEIHWAIQDFQARFGRAPEGMWLAETAVDMPTLEVLARAGIRFTILAPRQAASVRRSNAKEFTDVNENTLDTTRPYLVPLSEGRHITIFFYHGQTSRAVAFERLLESGENFWNRLADFPHGLNNIATDGESYGHHFMFGEMALAYAIEQARQKRGGVHLTNYAAYLAANPAQDEVRIHEHSSWSCVHGLERWKTHCGCSDGGHPDWIQDWRRPLRRALNYLKYYVDEHYFKAAPQYFTAPQQALTEYGAVLSGSDSLTAFLQRHIHPNPTVPQQQDACRLLAMQRFSLASFSSCAWFFDDIARLEPLNGLTCARRAMDLLLASGGPDIEAGFVAILEEACSNMAEHMDGAFLWNTEVTPRRPSLRELGAYLRHPGQVNDRMVWPGLVLTRRATTQGEDLEAFWTRTMEQETSQESGPFGCAQPSRHSAEIGYRFSMEQEQDLLTKSCLTAQQIAPYLDAFSEGQNMPQAFLAMQIPGLVWSWLVDNPELPRDVLTYLPVWLNANPDVRRVLERMVEKRGRELARRLPETAQELTRLISQSRRVGLVIHWWEVQNIVMMLPSKAVLAELCQLINIGASDA